MTGERLQDHVIDRLARTGSRTGETGRRPRCCTVTMAALVGPAAGRPGTVVDVEALIRALTPLPGTAGG